MGQSRYVQSHNSTSLNWHRQWQWRPSFHSPCVESHVDISVQLKASAELSPHGLIRTDKWMSCGKRSTSRVSPCWKFSRVCGMISGSALNNSSRFSLPLANKSTSNWAKSRNEISLFHVSTWTTFNWRFKRPTSWVEANSWFSHINNAEDGEKSCKDKKNPWVRFQTMMWRQKQLYLLARRRTCEHLVLARPHESVEV